jgi:hypothetical protein
MPDMLGASGNGDAWYCPVDADITTHPIYQSFSKDPLASVDVASVKGLIGGMVATSETAPILNYLRWLLALALSIA